MIRINITDQGILALAIALAVAAFCWSMAHMGDAEMQSKTAIAIHQMDLEAKKKTGDSP